MDNNDIKKIENLKVNEDCFVIRWKLTSLCNYNCAFCIQGSKEKHISKSIGESKKTRMIICNQLIKFIENKLNNNYKELKIYLIGGEITILNDLPEIVEKLVTCNFNGKITFHITTNLSADKSFLNKIKDIFITHNNRILQISGSFYKEFTNAKEFMDKAKIFHMSNNFKIFLNKLIFKRSTHNNISITVGYPILNDDDYNDYLKFKKKYKHYVNMINPIVIRKFKTFVSDSVSKNFKPKSFKRIRVTLENGKIIYFPNTSGINLAMNNKLFNPNGYLCDSGVNNISIDNMGNVSRCCSCTKESTYANIITDELEILNNKFICPTTMCSCDYYRTIEKNKSIN